MKATRVVALLAMASVLLPLAARAQRAASLACFPASWSGASRVSKPGPYAALPGVTVRLQAKYDGETLEIGYIRPDVPDGLRVPIIVRASPYLYGGLQGELRSCSAFLVDNFVQHGYAIAFLPVPGTDDTGACFDLMGPVERSYLNQAITWLGTRSWSNGNVGMIGLSYDGSTPWEVAATGNPHLRTIVPVSGVQDVYDLMFHAGVAETRGISGLLDALYYSYGFLQYNATNGRSAQHMITGVACPAMLAGLALSGYSGLTGARDPLGFWSARNSRPGVEANYHGSVLLVNGLQDWNVDPEHTVPFAQKLAAAGVPVHVVLGQWEHALPDYTGNGIAVRGDWADLLLGWFDRWLKEDTSIHLGPRVQVQDTNGQWRYESDWPPPSRSPRALYPTVDGNLTTVAPAMNGERIATGVALGSVDPDRCTGCSDLAFFQSTAQSDDIHLTGAPQIDLSVIATGPGGHLVGALYAVAPNGRQTRLGWGQVDLRYPHGEETMGVVVPGLPMSATLRFEPLDAVAPSGSKLVLAFTQGGSADHAPSVPTYPVRVQLGSGGTVVRFDTVTPDPSSVFSPPWISS